MINTWPKQNKLKYLLYLLMAYKVYRVRTLIFDFNASVGQNPHLCESGQCNKTKKKKKSIVTPLVAWVSGVLILLVVVAVICWTLNRRKSKGEATIIQD